MNSFQRIYDRALASRGEAELLASLPEPASASQLRSTPNADYLAEMTKCVFRAGFIWKIVGHKWPHFEQAFADFNPAAVAYFSDERLEAISQNKAIIRHMTKIVATRANAAFVLDIAASHGSFGNFIADWPADDVTGLLLHLKKHGSRLGGHTGQYFLRFMGKDTFIFSKDVVTVLIAEGVIDKEPTSKSGLAAVQLAFNTWQQETQLPYCQLSRIMAASLGPQG